MERIGFGGGCHWCTEAVFQFFKGVEKVEQGWISSPSPNEAYSEAVIVHYHTEKINLEILIEAHLMTHASTVNHRFRTKYRSAIYYFSEADKITATDLLQKLEEEKKLNYIIQMLPFAAFKLNEEKYLNYFQQNKEAPFCQTYIIPKLKMLQQKFTQKGISYLLLFLISVIYF